MNYGGIEMPENGVMRNGVVFKQDVLGEWWLCPDCNRAAGSKISAIYHQAGKSCDKMAPR